MKKITLLIFILFVSLFFSSCQNVKHNEKNLSNNKEIHIKLDPSVESPNTTKKNLDDKYINVKYRDSLVNINNGSFEYLNTNKSSFIRGSWYDKDNKYMIIKLNNVYYHYCGLNEEKWNMFKNADSFGSFYKNFIKGNYDCRMGFIPNY